MDKREIVSLNAEDLDVEELEHRLELSAGLPPTDIPLYCKDNPICWDYEEFFDPCPEDHPWDYDPWR